MIRIYIDKKSSIFILKQHSIGEQYMYSNSILDFFSRGGYQFMIPLLVLSVISLAVILERIHFLWLCCSISKDHFHSLRSHIRKSEFEEASKIASGKPTLPYAIISGALNMVLQNPGKISFVQSLQKSADRHITWLSKRFWLLKSVAYLSPMLGLLGTVVGLRSLLAPSQMPASIRKV
jgi:biopolymer transport protein ExbB